MDAVAILLAIVVWFVVLGVALFLAPGSGGAAQIGTWLVLSLVTTAVEFIVLFLATYGLLFFVGKEAALVGAVASAIILAATPVAWAVVVHRRARRSASHG